MPATETILSTLPAASEKDRLLLVLVQHSGDGSRMELRQQSFSHGVGWFTQSTVVLEPDQVSQLRSALGMTAASRGRTDLPQEMKRITTPAWQPRVIHADSA
ncbi:MAG TPA: hypothetical protein VMP01_05900 [Pirellulaceae bacterium]|nr:hypothetical protein [Pirellulaceae bacterium]